jgi:hypothetical protein
MWMLNIHRDFMYGTKFCHVIIIHYGDHQRKWTTFALPDTKVQNISITDIVWYFKDWTWDMFIYNRLPYELLPGIIWLLEFIGIIVSFIIHWLWLFLCNSYLSSCNWSFHFTATDQLEKCGAPRSIAHEGSQLDRNEFVHNFNISYKCRGKQEYEYSICINGRWDPEPTCTSKFMFFVFRVLLFFSLHWKYVKIFSNINEEIGVLMPVI